MVVVDSGPGHIHRTIDHHKNACSIYKLGKNGFLADLNSPQQRSRGLVKATMVLSPSHGVSSAETVLGHLLMDHHYQNHHDRPSAEDPGHQHRTAFPKDPSGLQEQCRLVVAGNMTAHGCLRESSPCFGVREHAQRVLQKRHWAIRSMAPNSLPPVHQWHLWIPTLSLILARRLSRFHGSRLWAPRLVFIVLGPLGNNQLEVLQITGRQGGWRIIRGQNQSKKKRNTTIAIYTTMLITLDLGLRS